MNVDGHLVSADYVMIQMEPYWEDVPEKREALLGWLDQTDYIILSSNRLYGSIPRLPERYPMTTRYYEMLFSGELGYEKVAEFTSRPRLFGVEIADDNADESFTVYDHPKVTVFRKTTDFDLAAIRSEFEQYDLDHVVRLTPRQADRAPHQLMLTGETLAAQRKAGTWSQLYDRDGASNRLPTLFWLLMLYVIQVAVWPLMAGVARALPDGGHGLSKAAGLLLVAYLSWVLPAVRVAPYSGTLVWLGLALVATLSAWRLWRHGDELLAFLQRRWRLLLAEEGLFLLLFAGMWLIRQANPDLWHPVVGGEKPMDLAYLNAVLKSTYFPPYDPWFAGGAMNYYYWGWVIVGALIKLTGILPTVAYNLALPTLFALLGTGVASVVLALASSGDEDKHWLPRGFRLGLAGVALVCVVGNLGELKLLVQGFVSLGGMHAAHETPTLVKFLVGLWVKLSTGEALPFRPEWWYWNATRVMGNGEINEFPFFSYLYGDLHAHVMALPFTVLALGLAINLMRRLQICSSATDWAAVNDITDWIGWLKRHLRTFAGPAALLALVLGALWCINTWDWPTYTGLAAIALAIGSWQGAKAGHWRSLLAAGGVTLVVVALSRVFFQPYHASYGFAYSKIDRWDGERTSLSALAILYALPLFVLLWYLVQRTRHGALSPALRYWRLVRRYGRHRTRQLVGVLVEEDLCLDAQAVVAVLAVLVMVVAAVDGQWAVVVAAPLGLLALCEALTAPSVERRLTAVFIGAVAFLVLFVDWFVLGGDVGRMNTVFKFSLQAWVLAGIAMAVALGWLLGRRERKTLLGQALKAILVALLIGVALYPPFATYGRLTDRWPGVTTRGLDGSAYMAQATYQDGEYAYTLAHDQAAIRWMQDNIVGSPVIVEAVTPLYRWGGRISVYTGLPTVLGWDWHEKQQRAAVSGQIVDWRLDDVAQLYNTASPHEALRIIERYDIALIYVGEVERAYYDRAGLQKLDAMVGSVLDVVYQQGPVTIYRVRGADVLMSDGQASTGGHPAWLAAINDWLSRHVIIGPVRAESPEDALLLDEPVEDLPVARVGWNRLANAHWPLALIDWYVALQLMGWGAYGLLAPALGWLDDRGHGLSKGIGWALVSYLIWLPASLGVRANTTGAIWAVTAALTLAGGLVGWRRRVWRGLPWRTVLAQEGLFAGALLMLAVVRLLNPDLWQPWYGGEKMMESAYYQAVARSETMPPYDPYFAGGVLNYYYLGLFQANIPLKLVGLRPEIAFNLAVPTLFALTATHAFWAGRQLAKADGAGAGWRGGIAALLLVAVMGNLTGGIQLVEQTMQIGGATLDGHFAWGDVAAFARGFVQLLGARARLPAFDYWWRATRVVPNTINEFPSFSFLFADLHPHLTALPLTTLTLGMIVAAVRAPRRGLVALGLAAALTYGALGPANTWDLPTFGLAIVGAGLVWSLGHGTKREVLLGLSWGLGVVALGLALYAPFYQHYQAQSLRLGLVAAPSRSSLAYWLQIWGFFLLAVICLLYVGLAPQGHEPPERRRGRDAASVVLLVAVAGGALLAVCGAATLGLLMPLLVATLMLWLCDSVVPERSCVAMLLALGLAVLAGVEVVYLKDFLDGTEWSRMNTVFKFHLQAWVLLGVALGGAWPRLSAALRARGRAGKTAHVLVTVLLGCGMLYPFLGTPARIAERMPYGEPPRWTFDGIAFMATGAYDWPDAEHRIELSYDLEAIRWLQANVTDNAVVAEAAIGYYREGGLRLSSFTGLPTLVGMHQGEQRPWTQVTPRQQDADTIYTATDPQRVAEVLDRLSVRYVYWGQLERAAYPQNDGRIFEEMEAAGLLRRAFVNDRSVIWAYTPQH